MKKLVKVLSLAMSLLLLGCVLSACSSAPAATATLTFGTNAEFPPFDFVTANGTIGEFDGSLWGSMVEFVTVGRNKEITFTFRDNTEIQA